MAQRVIPFSDQAGNHGLINRVLVAEVVIDIRFRQARSLRDFGDSRAVESLAGEDPHSRVENARAVSIADPGTFRLCRFGLARRWHEFPSQYRGVDLRMHRSAARPLEAACIATTRDRNQAAKS